MKNIKTFAGGVIAVAIVCVAIFAAISYERDKIRREQAEQIISQGPLGLEDSSSENIREIKRAIAAYEKRIEKHVQDAAKNANYWKLLAVRLQNRGLHGDALEALEQALYYAPADPLLHYYTGVSAGIMAKSFHSFSGTQNTEREHFYSLAEEAFLRAIELDNTYLRPRYSLGVLYVFDLERPEEAVSHLERCLEISRGDVDTMFVLARAFYMLGRFKEAVDLYDRIITISWEEQKRIDAQNNRQNILGQMNG